MRIEGFESKYMQSRSYLVTEGNRGIVIDPAGQDDLMKRVVEQKLVIDYIFLTHEHCDHIVGVNDIRNQSGATVICTKLCGESIADSRSNYSRYFEAFAALQQRYRSAEDLHVEPFTVTADRTFEGTMEISWEGHTVELVPTPGHSPGSMCILIDSIFLFSGDTLFRDDDIMLGFIGGCEEQYLHTTVPWLKSLNPKTLVYPGHLESFYLGERIKKRSLEEFI